jgi:hypothetical protein
MDYKSQYISANITTQTTTLVVTGSGVLHTITFNKPTATGTVTIYNGIDAGGTVLGTITTPSSPQPFTLTYDIAFGAGLTIVTETANQDITITYSQG